MFQLQSWEWLIGSRGFVWREGVIIRLGGEKGLVGRLGRTIDTGDGERRDFGCFWARNMADMWV